MGRLAVEMNQGNFLLEHLAVQLHLLQKANIQLSGWENNSLCVADGSLVCVRVVCTSMGLLVLLDVVGDLQAEVDGSFDL